MSFELRSVGRYWLVGLCVSWLCLAPGCDAIKSATEKKEEPIPTAPVGDAPASTPPAPVEQVTPPPMVKTPQQIIEEFLALPSHERNDANLKQVAELTEGLDAITTLDLTRSSVSDEGLKLLTAFPQLTELNLSDTRASNAGMTSISGVKTLRVLTLANLRGVDDIGVQNLSPLTDLESITINACAVTDTVLPTLASFKGLQVLNLGGNPDIYGRDFHVLASKGAFKQLRELIVSGSKFGFYGLEQINKLPQLEVLRASSCELAGPALNGLNGCDQLKVLDLSRNTLQDDNIKGVGRLKNLEELKLSQLSLTDESLNSIKLLKKLKLLDLNGTRVTAPAIQLLKDKFLKETEIIALDQKF